MLHISVGVSVFRKTRLGGRFGDHVSYLVCVETVVRGVLMAAVREAVAKLVAIRCCSIGYVLVGPLMPASDVV